MVVKNLFKLALLDCRGQSCVRPSFHNKDDRQQELIIKPPLIRNRIIDIKSGITVSEVSEVPEERVHALDI